MKKFHSYPAFRTTASLHGVIQRGERFNLVTYQLGRKKAKIHRHLYGSSFSIYVYLVVFVSPWGVKNDEVTMTDDIESLAWSWDGKPEHHPLDKGSLEVKITTTFSPQGGTE